MWEAHEGRELRVGAARGPGFRLYVAVAGGIDVPPVLGSRATYTMGAVGGHEGRALVVGDRLPVGAERGEPRPFTARPEYTRDWEIRAMRGPQSAPDFLTEADMEMLFSRSWSVNPNSNRTGIRLEGGTFEWARRSGGIAGGHPSNILDNGYPVGAVNINGDLPVILCVDGPTAGGFVVAANRDSRRPVEARPASPRRRLCPLRRGRPGRCNRARPQCGQLARIDAIFLHNTQMVSVAILGASGFAGQETLDRVLSHPELGLLALGSDSHAGEPAAALDPRTLAERPRAAPGVRSERRSARRGRGARLRLR
jgi:hypothetical protein